MYRCFCFLKFWDECPCPWRCKWIRREHMQELTNFMSISPSISMLWHHPDTLLRIFRLRTPQVLTWVGMSVSASSITGISRISNTLITFSSSSRPVSPRILLVTGACRPALSPNSTCSLPCDRCTLLLQTKAPIKGYVKRSIHTLLYELDENWVRSDLYQNVAELSTYQI